jgi:hypothetical protein
MSGKLRVMTGLITTFIFLGIGGALLSEGHNRIGALLAGLGVLRGGVVIRQAWGLVAEDDEDEDDI